MFDSLAKSPPNYPEESWPTDADAPPPDEAAADFDLSEPHQPHQRH